MNRFAPLPFLIAAAISCTAQAQGPASAEGSMPGSEQPRYLFGNLQRDADAFTLVNETPGLSFHKPMYMLPFTYSSDYRSEETEMVFQISLKQRLFARNIFFGYTQKSFWQVYNGDDSRPFRETNFNPELFYRWKPEYAACSGCGLDIGIDHESNGQEVGDSRSWNRIILAAYRETGKTLVHLRVWYRIPEDPKRTQDDPKGDDNPDIERYYGYGELRLQRKLFDDDKHMAALMLRGNPSTGKGALQLTYSIPFGDYAFWAFNLWHGYGESMIDYNHSITRVGIGVMLAR